MRTLERWRPLHRAASTLGAAILLASASSAQFTVLVDQVASNGLRVRVITIDEPIAGYLGEIDISVSDPSSPTILGFFMQVYLHQDGSAEGRMFNVTTTNPGSASWTFEPGSGSSPGQQRMNGTLRVRSGGTLTGPAWATLNDVLVPGAWTTLAQSMRTLFSNSVYRRAGDALDEVGLAPAKNWAGNPANTHWAMYWFARSALPPPPCTSSRPWQCRAWARGTFSSWAFLQCVALPGSC